MINGTEAGLLLMSMPVGAVALLFMDKILAAVFELFTDE